jgi:hypothetical protein
MYWCDLEYKNGKAYYRGILFTGISYATHFESITFYSVYKNGDCISRKVQTTYYICEYVLKNEKKEGIEIRIIL